MNPYKQSGTRRSPLRVLFFILCCVLGVFSFIQWRHNGELKAQLAAAIEEAQTIRSRVAGNAESLRVLRTMHAAAEGRLLAQLGKLERASGLHATAMRESAAKLQLAHTNTRKCQQARELAATAASTNYSKFQVTDQVCSSNPLAVSC